MPTIQEDKRALNIIAGQPDHPSAPQVMGTLGIDRNDLRAFQISNDLEEKNPDDQRIGRIRNQIFQKIATKRPTENAAGFGVGGAGVFDRFVAKNVIDQDPKVQETYFKRRGFDTRTSKEGNLEVRGKGKSSFEPVDPEGIDIFDAFDVVGDLIEGAVSTIGGTAAGIAALPAGPIAAGAAGLAAGGAISGAFEAGRQGVSALVGARDEVGGAEIAKQTAAGVLVPAAFKSAGGLFKGTGKVIGKVLSKFQGGLKKTSPEIEAAAKELGAKATPGQLFDSPAVQKAESAQFQSVGLIGGQGLRNQIKSNQIAVQNVADGIVQGASASTKLEVGDQVGKELSEELAKRLAPAETIYDSLETLFRRRAFKPDLGPLREKFTQLKHESRFVEQNKSALEQFEKTLDQVRNLDDLKEFRSSIGAVIGDSPLNKPKVRLFSKLYGAATESRTNTFLDLVAKEGSKGKTGKFFLEKKALIEKADKIYKDSIEEISNVIMAPGKKIKGSPKQVLEDFLEKNKEISRINTILNTNDPVKIAKIQKDFPGVFEKLKDVTIADISTRSLKKGEVNPGKLADIIIKLPPETANLLFGANGVKKAKAIRVYLDSIPEKIGQSGTPEGQRLLRPKLVLDNLFSIGRDININLRTKAQLEQDVLAKIGRVLQGKTPSALGIAGFAGRERDQPQLGKKKQPRLGVK